jgi:hypothetical protein
MADLDLAGAGRPIGTWTGREWVVLDGPMDTKGGSVLAVAYDPAAGSWRDLPRVSLPPSYSAAVVWTGDEVIAIVNPVDGPSIGLRLVPDGTAWREIAPAPFDGASAGSTAIWSGREILVATSGEEVPGTTRTWDQVVAYDPAIDAWRIASLPPDGLHTLEPVWTESFAMFFAGSQPAVGYEPSSDRWLRFPPTGDDIREGAAQLSAGEDFIAWGGQGAGAEEFLQDGITFAPGFPLTPTSQPSS